MTTLSLHDVLPILPTPSSAAGSHTTSRTSIPSSPRGASSPRLHARERRRPYRREGPPRLTCGHRWAGRHPQAFAAPRGPDIGRASGREGESQEGENLVVAVSLKKKKAINEKD